MAVVADAPVVGMLGSEDTRYYGGHMVAESVAPQNRPLISAAPEMFDALQEARIQIQYMHAKFRETGSGNAVLARIERVLLKAANFHQVAPVKLHRVAKP